MERRLSRWNLLLAFLAIPLVVGGIAGLIDGIASLIGAGAGSADRGGLALFLLAPSLGALLATVPVLFVAAPAFAFGSRRPETLLAISAGTLLLLSPAFVLFRFLYKRLPWNAVETCAAILGVVALGLAIVLLARLGSRILGANGARAAAFLTRWTPWLLLILIPALVRGVPAAWNEIAAESRPRFSSAAFARPNSRAGANLLLLTIDTIRADSFGACGDPAARTPHLDRFARRSLQFPLCVAPAPWTLPSLASLLTGRYPGEHKVLEALTAPPDSIRSLAEVLSQEGRSTAGFVSNPWLATGTLARGFGTFDVAERLECYRELRSTQLYRALSKVLLRTRQLDRGERITARGLRWIDGAARQDAPWFAWLHYFDPHLPNWPEPPLDRLTGPPPRHVDASITVEQIRAGDYSGGEEGREEIERLYRGEVTATDHSVGRVLRHLEAGGLFDRTIVVVTGDHGEEFWEHGDYGHGHAMYDEVVCVPLLLSAPQVERARIDGRMARIVDLAPTLLSLLGVADPAIGKAGSSLVAPDEDPDREAYGEATLYGPEKKFLRSERWKIVFTPPSDSSGTMSLEVFDLARDPAERRDLSSENPAMADTLMPRLAQWIQRVGSSRSTSSGSIPGGVDPSIEEQLRALGYIQ